MSHSNFANGALVFRIWRFDGGCEILGKFQYWDHADLFASALLVQDIERGANKSGEYFYLAVCENEVRAKAFGAKTGAAA